LEALTYVASLIRELLAAEPAAAEPSSLSPTPPSASATSPPSASSPPLGALDGATARSLFEQDAADVHEQAAQLRAHLEATAACADIRLEWPALASAEKEARKAARSIDDPM
jgi:hypothetical protein